MILLVELFMNHVDTFPKTAAKVRPVHSRLLAGPKGNKAPSS